MKKLLAWIITIIICIAIFNEAMLNEAAMKGAIIGLEVFLAITSYNWLSKLFGK